MAQRLALERVDVDAARLANRLFTHRAWSRLHLGGRSARWRWHAPVGEAAPHGLNLVLASDEARCSLALHGSGLGTYDETIDLGAFRGEALCEAATLRYAALLDHLEALTGRVWHVADVDSPAWQEQGLRAAFTIEFEAEDPMPVHGEVCITGDGFAAWRDLAGDPVDASALLAPVVLSADLLIGDVLPYTRKELSRLRVGGALLLQRHQAAAGAGWPCWLRWPHGIAHTLAELQRERVVLRSGLRAGVPPTFTDERSSPMTSSSIAAGSSADALDADASTRAALDALPLTLEFRVGQISMPLAELSGSLAPGRVFELGQTLGPETVSVRSGGVELARGELIEVGDRLAVRIAQLSSAHGSL
jgi:type III secretion system YscQ/HrcQ family protein